MGAGGGLFRTKSVEQSIRDTDEPDSKLRKDLTARDLTVFGVAVVIGAGLIQVAGELHGTDRTAVEADVTRIFDRCRDIIATAREAGISIGAAANLFAEQRLDGAI